MVREKPRRINGLVERRKLQIEEEKLQNSRDFKEITFAITLFGGLLAFLIKLGDYFNNNVLEIGGLSITAIYITAGVTLIVLILLFLFLILKWFLISISESKLKTNLKNITQNLFSFTPFFILVWFISVFLNFIIYYLKDENTDIINVIIVILAVFIIVLIIVFIKESRKISIQILILFLFLLLLLLIPSYFLTGSYSIEIFQPSYTNSDIITFTIKETGISFSYNYINLNKLEEGYDIFHYIDNITINGTQETVSKNKLMLGIQHGGLWYLNLNTSNLTSGNYMLHAEVTNDLTKKSIFGTIKKHDDILFYIPPKTALNSYNSTNRK